MKAHPRTDLKTYQELFLLVSFRPLSISSDLLMKWSDKATGEQMFSFPSCVHATSHQLSLPRPYLHLFVFTHAFELTLYPIMAPLKPVLLTG